MINRSCSFVSSRYPFCPGHIRFHELPGAFIFSSSLARYNRAVREALRNIRRRKARSALTIFGVAIGIFAFTTMGALSENITNSLNRTLDYYTSRIIVGASSGGGQGGVLFAQGGQLPSSISDRVKVIDGVEKAYPTISLPAEEDAGVSFSDPPIIYGFNPADASTDPQQLAIKTGRALTEKDTGKVVVGSSIVQSKKLKVGDTLTLRGQQFTVVGTLDRTGGAPDSYYMVTLPEAQQMVRQSNTFASEAGEFVTNVVVIPQSGVDADQLAKTIQDKVSGVTAQPPNELKKQIKQATNIFQLIILGSALIAVIVGSLSVINTMVMSVAERRKELGVKMVVGAKARHILKEIITETSAMGLIGGVVGFAGGVLLTALINNYTSNTGVTIFTITPKLALVSIGGAVVLGMVAGLYPALRAARIKPVKVLREE